MRQTLARSLLAALVALLCSVVSYGSVFAQEAVPKESPTDADISAAKNHMAAGVAFMQDPDGARYEEGYPEFRKAYEKSGSLNALHNLAICAQKLELDGEAIGYYQSVLEKKGDSLDENDKGQITRDLAALKASVAWVTFSADKGQTTMVDERTPRSGSSIRNTYQIGITGKKFGIHPGAHKFSATTEGGAPQQWVIEITGGGSFNHEFIFDKNAPVTAEGFTEADNKPQPQPDEADDEGGLPIYVYVAGGVTIVAAIPMAIFMAMSSSKKSEYDDDILGKASIADQEEAADSLKSTNLLADVFLGITAAAAVTTVILVVLAMGDDGESAANEGPRFGIDYTVTPMVDHRGSAGAVFTTNF